MILDLPHVLKNKGRLLDRLFLWPGVRGLVVLSPLVIQALTPYLDHCTVLHFRDCFCSWLWSVLDVLLVDVTEKYHARPLITIPTMRICWLHFLKFVGALRQSILESMRTLKCLLRGLLGDKRTFETVTFDVVKRWLGLGKRLSVDSFRSKRGILVSCGESRPLL